MTAEPLFAPTLPIPAEWIAELTGTSGVGPAEIHLSYTMRLLERMSELDSSPADIEADLGQGHCFARRGAPTSAYFVFESSSFVLWAQPQPAKNSGAPLIVINRIERWEE